VESDSRLKPVTDARTYRRNTTHIEEPGSYRFVTFTTVESFALSDPAKTTVFDTIKFHSGKKYNLFACVVMETHAHCVLQPIEESSNSFYSLAQIMHSIKSYSANRIQRLFGKEGQVWLTENYDRIIRDDKDYLEKMNYLINNPVKAGIVERPEDYRWLFIEESDCK
jgi:putative transposase